MVRGFFLEFKRTLPRGSPFSITFSLGYGSSEQVVAQDEGGRSHLGFQGG